jgi:1,2-phenylacetyl-CoA epoxidase catalytic subunit
MGEGWVHDASGTAMESRTALDAAGIEPLELCEKEGLALINGTDGMTAMLVMAIDDLRHLLRVADTCLILGQRLSEWCGHAPIIEEDIALSNTALDLIGQARALLTHAGRSETGQSLDEDQLAFLREERD